MSEPEKLTQLEIPELEASLQRGDILLVHTKGNPLLHPIAWAIRWGTSSYWNHAALIHLIPSESEGYPDAFTIESQGQGIDIHRLSEYYLKYTDKYDLGIKRLAAPWYGDGNDPHALEFARKVRGFALQEIDDKYSFKTILRIAGKYWWIVPTALAKAKVRTISIMAALILAIVWLIIWLVTTIPQIFFTALALGVIVPLIKFLPELQERKGKTVFFKGDETNNYICSGFVQWVYYSVFNWFRLKGNLTVTMKPEDIDFTNWEWEKSLLDKTKLTPEENDRLSRELLSTTPADLAMSGKLAWLFYVKDGKFCDLPGPK